MILYPTGDNATQLLRNTGTTNYGTVDELVYDDGTTYVSNYTASYSYDVYDMSDPPTTGNGSVILGVTVYTRVSNHIYWVSATNCFKEGFAKNGAFYNGSELCLTSNDVWTYKTTGSAINPFTSSAWTWDDIKNLQVAIWMKETAGIGEGRCTEVYVKVDYVEPGGEIIRPEKDLTTQLTVFGKVNHFEAVNESVLNTTDNIYLWQDNTWKFDRFQLENSSVSSGDINSVTAYGILRGAYSGTGSWGLAKFITNISDSEDTGWEQRIRVDYGNYSQTWDKNPSTGNNWTWEDIDNLNGGVYLQAAGTTLWIIQDFQLYYIVNYTSAVVVENSPPYGIVNSPANESYENDFNWTLINVTIYDVDNNVSDVLIFVNNDTDYLDFSDGLVYERLSVSNGSEVIYNLTSLPIKSNHPNLVMMLRLDNRSELGEDDTSVYDVKLGNTGDVNGAVWNISGKFAGGYTFDGINDFINVSYYEGLNITEKLTLSAWIYGYNVSELQDRIVHKRYDISRNDYGLFVSEGYIQFRATDCSSNETDFGTVLSRVTANEWHYIVATFDDSTDTVKLYVDGNNTESTSSFTRTICGQEHPVQIGGHSDHSSGRWFNGTIDEVAIFNTTLTDTEILNYYRLESQKYYWFMNITDRVDTNSTGMYEFTINTSLETQPCDCPASGDWVVDCSENCFIEEECNLGSNSLYLQGTGSFGFGMDIYAYRVVKSPGCTFWHNKSSKLVIPLK